MVSVWLDNPEHDKIAQALGTWIRGVHGSISSHGDMAPPSPSCSSLPPRDCSVLILQFTRAKSATAVKKHHGVLRLGQNIHAFCRFSFPWVWGSYTVTLAEWLQWVMSQYQESFTLKCDLVGRGQRKPP